jgi:hypothetical protein
MKRMMMKMASIAGVQAAVLPGSLFANRIKNKHPALPDYGAFKQDVLAFWPSLFLTDARWGRHRTGFYPHEKL